jgi:hypothetical protein
MHVQYSNRPIYLHKNPPICIMYEMRRKVHYAITTQQHNAILLSNHFVPCLEKE